MATLEESLLTDIAHNKDLVRSSVGDFELISGLANVQNALFRRLVTQPGAVIHRPDYGVGIGDFQNAPQSIETQRKIALRIGQQFVRDPRVESVDGVSVTFGKEDVSETIIKVRLTVVGYNEVSMNFKPFSDGVS